MKKNEHCLTSFWGFFKQILKVTPNWYLAVFLSEGAIFTVLTDYQIKSWTNGIRLLSVSLFHVIGLVALVLIIFLIGGQI